MRSIVPALFLCLILAAPALADAPVCAIKPVAATHVMPPYPPMSEQLGEQGMTELKVAVGADGAPIDVSVFKSSGSLRLDDAASSYVKQSWRWQVGAQCKSGSVLMVAINWKLKTVPQELPPIILVSVKALLPDAANRNEQGSALVTLVIGKDGSVQPGIVSGTGFEDLDRLSLVLAAAHKWTPVLMDGRPVKGVAFVVVEWTPTGKKPDADSPPQ